jgi:hypothetical protein
MSDMILTPFVGHSGRGIFRHGTVRASAYDVLTLFWQPDPQQVERGASAKEIEFGIAQIECAIFKLGPVAERI